MQNEYIMRFLQTIYSPIYNLKKNSLRNGSDTKLVQLVIWQSAGSIYTEV